MSAEKKQRLLFAVTMSYTMTVGMELYNLSLRLGLGRRAGALAELGRELGSGGLAEMAALGGLVLLLSHLWGRVLSGRPRGPRRRQLTMVAVMCPTMSLVAALLFQVLPGLQPLARLPYLWLTTFLRNLPMALLWSLLVAAPWARWLSGRLSAGPSVRYE